MYNLFQGGVCFSLIRFVILKIQLFVISFKEIIIFFLLCKLPQIKKTILVSSFLRIFF